MAHSIETPTARAKLAPKRSPYWRKLQPGHYVGWRCMTAGSPGNWSARVISGRTEQSKPLGQLLDVAPAAQFATAKRLAEAWFATLETGAASSVPLMPARVTMQEACVAYVEQQARKSKRAGDAAARAFKSYVQTYDDEAIGKWWGLPLASIPKAAYKRWHAWLSALPTDPWRPEQPSHGHKRAVSTIARDVTLLRAALNLAHDTYEVAAHWAGAFKSPKTKKARRGAWAYIDLEQRRTLLDAARRVRPDVAPMIEALLRLPVRPGAFAALTAAHFEARARVLRIGPDKTVAATGRVIPLGDDKPTLDFFAAQTKNKIAGAPLFTQADGRAWNCERWGVAMKECVEAAGLDPRFSMYCLRHCRITDLVDAGGISLPVIAHLAGTSTKYIEENYYHLRDEAATKAVAVAGF